jgi:hypothetical protein
MFEEGDFKWYQQKCKNFQDYGFRFRLLLLLQMILKNKKESTYKTKLLCFNVIVN